MLANREAGEILFYDKGRDAVVALGLIGHGEHHERLGLSGIGNEALHAVEHIVVALQHGGGLLAGGISTGAGLGQTKSAQLTATEQIGQILHLLLLGAVGVNRITAKRGMGADNNGRGTAGLGNLLHAHGVGQVVRTGAAVLHGERDAQHAQLGQLRNGLLGETLLLVQLGGQGLDLVLCKFAIHLTEHLMLFRQRKIHVLFSLLCAHGQEIRKQVIHPFPFRVVILTKNEKVRNSIFRYAESYIDKIFTQYLCNATKYYGFPANIYGFDSIILTFANIIGDRFHISALCTFRFFHFAFQIYGCILKSRVIHSNQSMENERKWGTS